MTREYTSSGYRDNDSTFHHGVTIPHNKPTTGVIQNNTIEWLGDEIQDSIDVDWKDWLRDFEERAGREPTDEERDEVACNFENSTHLIGDWRFNETTGLYEHVIDGPKGYAAIVGEIYTQVLWSKTTERCALCSPCFPGQASVGVPGDYDAYTLPSDLMGFNVTEACCGFALMNGRTITPPVIPQTD